MARNTPFPWVSQQEHCLDRPWWVDRRERNPLYRHSLFESVPDSLKFTNHRWRPFSAGSPAFSADLRTPNTGSGVRKHTLTRVDTEAQSRIGRLREKSRTGRWAPDPGKRSLCWSSGRGSGVVRRMAHSSYWRKTQGRKGFFSPSYLRLVLITMPSTDRATDRNWTSRIEHWTSRSRGRVAGRRRSPPPTDAHITTLSLMTPWPACSGAAWHLIRNRGSPGSWPPRSSPPPSPRGCCHDVRPVITIKPSVIYLFFLSFLMCVWFIPPTLPFHPRRTLRGKRGRSGSSVGRKWESEPNRCSGSWRGIVKIQVSSAIRAIRTLLPGAAVGDVFAPGYFCQNPHIFRPHPR